MKPINFPQSTMVLQRPSEMTDKECLPLPVWNDGKQCISCWKPTFVERFKILLTGKVWLGVLSGTTQPPVFISGENIFEKASIKVRFKDFLYQVKESVTCALKSARNGLQQPDKRKHFILGIAISLLVGVFLPLLGVLVGCIAGAIKEWLDKKGNSTPEWWDFVFTCLGALSAYPFALLVHLIW